MGISSQNIRELKSKVHHLKPVVIIGNSGLTNSVIQEIDRALLDHELIKIRANATKAELPIIIQEICAKTEATLIQSIGRIVAIYRKNIQED